jgi:hypothetical protein
MVAFVAIASEVDDRVHLGIRKVVRGRKVGCEGVAALWAFIVDDEGQVGALVQLNRILARFYSHETIPGREGLIVKMVVTGGFEPQHRTPYEEAVLARRSLPKDAGNAGGEATSCFPVPVKVSDVVTLLPEESNLVVTERWQHSPP